MKNISYYFVCAIKMCRNVSDKHYNNSKISFRRRWCVSSVWSTATLVLHRFMTTPLPPSTAQKPPKPRPASSDHLHPEPRVDCVVLHTPATPTIDVIFVHGLYGSLGNTWRQGEWRSKYDSEPTKEPLRRASITTTNDSTNRQIDIKDSNADNSKDSTKTDPLNDNNKEFDNMFKSDEMTFERDEKKFYEDIRKILPKDNAFITEKFYNNTLLDQVEIVGNYETQANFVKDLFERQEEENTEVSEEKTVCDCKLHDVKCEAGCGCLCDECYSPCWPRDWISVDYPGARVISINYTSDPYLWRPLWIKESKRQRLHERAEQMIAQLLDLGVGDRPIIWVGHSKGGLFIKQIYCEAYEAYQKLHKPNETEDSNVTNERRDHCNNIEYNNDNRINHNLENTDTDNSTHVDSIFNNNYGDSSKNSNEITNDKQNEFVYIENSLKEAIHINDIDTNDKSKNKEENVTPTIDELDNECVYIENSIKEAFHFNETECDDKSNLNNDKVDIDYKRQIFKNVYYVDRLGGCTDNVVNINIDDTGAFKTGDEEDGESLSDVNCIFRTAEDLEDTDDKPANDAEALMAQRRAYLWSRSAGFMFYSVPHRGSPLADIKTPITARSIELMEICKDCSLVCSLQARWLTAVAKLQPAVRSVVESRRTLMSVLWLRIVSVDSADPGIGTLNGVNVDHREICKPSSRTCLLYQELMRLMSTALQQYHV